MPDPAEIIASAIIQSPHQSPHLTGTGGPAWQHKSAMSMPGGQALALQLGEAAVQALTDAGWKIVPGWDPPQSALPSAAQIRSWLADHGWTRGEPGPSGALWWPPAAGETVAVPHDSSDPDALAAVIKRIAEREGQLAGPIAREMKQCGDE